MSGNNLFEKIVNRLDNSIIFIIERFKYFAIILLILLIGFAGGVFANITYDTPQKQLTIGESNITEMLSLLSLNTVSDEKPSPLERVKEDQIHVYKDRIIIDLKDAEWATFTDTNSMDPVIDSGSYAIEIVPSTPDDITVGDIISYKSDYASGIIIHRVLEIGKDADGWYCKTKGDNNKDVDPGRIRFSQIKRVVVGIIY